MSTYKESSIFKHYDDCLMSGCPGHEMIYTYQTTSDAFMVTIDSNLVFSGDLEVLKTFLSLLNVHYLGKNQIVESWG